MNDIFSFKLNEFYCDDSFTMPETPYDKRIIFVLKGAYGDSLAFLFSVNELELSIFYKKDAKNGFQFCNLEGYQNITASYSKIVSREGLIKLRNLCFLYLSYQEDNKHNSVIEAKNNIIEHVEILHQKSAMNDCCSKRTGINIIASLASFLLVCIIFYYIIFTIKKIIDNIDKIKEIGIIPLITQSPMQFVMHCMLMVLCVLCSVALTTRKMVDDSMLERQIQSVTLPSSFRSLHQSYNPKSYNPNFITGNADAVDSIDEVQGENPCNMETILFHREPISFKIKDKTPSNFNPSNFNPIFDLPGNADAVDSIDEVQGEKPPCNMATEAKDDNLCHERPDYNHSSVSRCLEENKSESRSIKVDPIVPLKGKYWGEFF